MGMPLRITFNNVDYNFKVVNTEPITKATAKIPIIINGENIDLVKENQGWFGRSESSNISLALVQAIGKAIELRFRL